MKLIFVHVLAYMCMLSDKIVRAMSHAWSDRVRKNRSITTFFSLDVIFRAAKMDITFFVERNIL